jgi:UDP-GlcNAc:undecaprenyl-phosphate/decaprenyl-phosphate GlcNAc-1-phosphate transferase
MIVTFIAAFFVSLGLTLAAERVATAANIVARPSDDRWSRHTVPLLGGVAIVIGTLAPTLLVTGGDRRILVVTITAAALAAVGLVDDVRGLSPQTKLLAQLLLCGVLLRFGFVLRLTGNPLLDTFVTLFWLVGITNSFNLLDNMDGLAATLALVAGAFRIFFFVGWENDTAGAIASAAFLGAVAGFLVRNFPPARIFMGDAGSLFLGFFLGALSISAPLAAYSRNVFAVLIIPVLLFLIPIFDTAFVTVTRLLGGRSPAVGGRDHTSHRLVAIGLSERGVVLFLGALAAASGGVAVLSYRTGLSYGVVLWAVLIIGLALLGVHLSGVHVVTAAEPRARTLLRVIADLQYKRQVLTLVLDVLLIPLAYYASYLLRFENDLRANLPLFYTSLPVILFAQLIALGGLGLYRGVWRYMGARDVLKIVRATTAGTVVAVTALTYLTRFAGLSRTVFVLDWVLLTALVLASRGSFRLFDELFRAQPPSFVRVLIYGAGHGGELIAREVLNNPELRRVPVGFIDDDHGKHRSSIHGLPVFGGADQLETVLRERHVGELILSSEKINGDGLARARTACEKLNVPLRRLSFRLE